MEITVTREVKTKIDLSLEVPAYFKHGAAFIKVLNQNEYIEVYTAAYSGERGVRIMDAKNLVALFAHEGEPILPTRFEAALNEVLSELKQLTNSQSINAVANQTEL